MKFGREFAAITISLCVAGHCFGANPGTGAERRLSERVQRLEEMVRGLHVEIESLRRGKDTRNGSLSPEMVKLDYPANDQYDALMISLQDVQTEVSTASIEKAARLVARDQMREAFAKGAISEASMRAMELQVSLDSLQEKVLSHRLEATSAKLRSLKGLQSGNFVDFVRGNRDTNWAQFRSCSYELRKSELTLKNAADQYERIHGSYLKGAAPWAKDHEAELDWKKAMRIVAGWKRKCLEQEKQYRAAEEEFQKIIKP